MSVWEVSQNYTDCVVCCLLTQREWIRAKKNFDNFVDIHILKIKMKRVSQSIHFEEIYISKTVTIFPRDSSSHGLTIAHLIMLWKDFHYIIQKQWRWFTRQQNRLSDLNVAGLFLHSWSNKSRHQLSNVGMQFCSRSCCKRYDIMMVHILVSDLYQLRIAKLGRRCFFPSDNT